MAGENQNTGPDTSAAGGVDPKQLQSTLKEVSRIQGDFQDSIRDSARELNKMLTSYEKIRGTLDSLKTSTININRIEKEVEKAKAKQVIQSNKVKELEAKIGEAGKKRAENFLKSENDLKKKQDELNRARLIGDKNLIASATKALILQERSQERLKNNIQAEEIAYAAQLKSLDVAKKGLETAEEYLENEKNIEKSLGKTGAAIKLVNRFTGLGKNLYGKMVEEAREGEGTTKKQVIAVAGLAAGYKLAEAGLDMVGNAASKAGNKLAGMSEDSGTIVRDLASNVSDLARKIPLVGGLLGGLVDGFAAILDLVLGVDNMIVKTGRQLNLSAEGARSLYRGLGAASQASGDIYTNGKKYLESQLELTKQLGTTNILNTEILRTNIKLKEFAGLEEETRARIAESATITGKTAEGTVKAVLGQVAGLQKATGISFQYQGVLKEVSSLGGYLGLQFAKYPKELTKSFLVTKTLGLELKKLDSMASGFLDFESSISKEFEAQLLTGKEINLTKAREAFLNNDLAGAAAEIAKHTGDAAGFSKMNRIQQDSLAEALGMSRDEMAEMLKQQELYTKFGATDREGLLKEVDLLRKAGREQEAIAKAGGEAAYNDLVRASAQEKLALFIEKIKQSVVEFVERSNIIEKIENFVNMLSNPDTIKGIIGTIKNVISSFIEIAGNVLGDVIESIGWFKNFFTTGKEGDLAEAKAKQQAASIRAGAAEIAGNIRGVGIEYKPESVGTNVAASQTAATGGASNAAANSMSMAPKNTVIQQNNVYLQDTAVTNAQRVQRPPQVDKQTNVYAKTG